jgi:hypothetical protein|tara:strand:- start:668 stop:898 length:231 start_codon:yes stop_codon:yes gene_type:complete
MKVRSPDESPRRERINRKGWLSLLFFGETRQRAITWGGGSGLLILKELIDGIALSAPKGDLVFPASIFYSQSDFDS